MPYKFNPFTTTLDFYVATSGDVTGPASSTDNAIARFNGTTGKLLQNSTVTLGDSNEFDVPSGQQITFGVNGLVGLTVNSARDVVANNSARIADYLRVGSTSAPSNTTTGDLTFVRGFATSLDLSGNLTISGTVDGRDVSTDGSSLDSHIAGTGTSVHGDSYLLNTGDTGSGNYALSGYLRVGSTSAPSNTTAGDLTAVRLKVGDGAFGTGVEASVTGDAAISGFLRVGSETAPANTTAGDLTAIRFVVGTNTAFGTDNFFRAIGISTATSNGAIIPMIMQLTINPASDSLSDFRALSMSATTQSGLTFNLDNITSGFFETRVQGTGNITSLVAFEGSNFINGSGFSGTVTDAVGLKITSVTTTANSPTATITTATGVLINNSLVGSGPMVITTLIGFDIAGQTAGSTNTYGLRLAFPGVNSSIVNTTDLIGMSLPTVSRTLGNQTATTTNAFGISIGIPTWTSTTNTRTITNAAGLYIAGAPVASTNVTITNGPYSLWIDAGSSRLDGRILRAQGADVASANDLTLGSDGNTFEITGTTQINAITTTGWTTGSMVTLIFTSTPTVKHNTAGGAGTAVLLLAGAADFSATAGDTLTLVYSEQGGTNAWREVGRAVI